MCQWQLATWANNMKAEYHGFVTLTFNCYRSPAEHAEQI